MIPWLKDRLGHIKKNRIFIYLGKGYVSRDRCPRTNKGYLPHI
jgi:hypothetical protein